MGKHPIAHRFEPLRTCRLGCGILAIDYIANLTAANIPAFTRIKDVTLKTGWTLSYTI